MAEDGQSEVENTPSVLSRRAFLKGTAAITGAHLLNATVTKIDVGRSTDTTATESTAVEPIDQAEEDIDFVLKNYNPEEREAARELIKKYALEYQSSYGFSDMVLNIHKKYRQIISNSIGFVSNATGKEIEDVWYDLIAGLIIRESSGRENPEDGEDIGLCQLRADAIADANKSLKIAIPTNNPNFFLDPQTNITFAMAYLMHIRNVSHTSPDLILLSYNLGYPSVTGLIEKYSATKQNLGINAYDLQKSPAATEITETIQYPFKLTGAAVAYRQILTTLKTKV